MSKKAGIAGAATAVMAGAVAIAPTVAIASPPSGGFSWVDTARVPAVGSADVRPIMGHSMTHGQYTFAEGASTGWRTLTGSAVLAVTSGALKVTTAEGCTTKDYAAGGAAVLQAGTHLITAEKGATVSAFVLDVRKAVTGDPLLAGRTAAVNGCAAPGGGTSMLKAAGVTTADAARGVLTAGGHHYVKGDGDHNDTSHAFSIQDGKDVGFSLYKFAPGFSTGWHSHYGPFAGIVTKGEIVYYEGTGSGCQEAGRYKAGDAYASDIKAHSEHNHIAEVAQDTEIWALYVNMPRTTAALPVAGQQLDSVDFSKMPDDGCMRLR